MNIDGIDPELADFDPFSPELISNSVRPTLQRSAVHRFYSWLTKRWSWFRDSGIKESRDYGGKTPWQFYHAKLDFLEEGKSPTRSGLKTRALFWFWMTLAIVVWIVMALICLIFFGIPAFGG